MPEELPRPGEHELVMIETQHPSMGGKVLLHIPLRFAGSDEQRKIIEEEIFPAIFGEGLSTKSRAGDRSYVVECPGDQEKARKFKAAIEETLG